MSIKLNTSALKALRTVNPRLIKLAKELGGVWCRVSGKLELAPGSCAFIML